MNGLLGKIVYFPNPEGTGINMKLPPLLKQNFTLQTAPTDTFKIPPPSACR